MSGAVTIGDELAALLMQIVGSDRPPPRELRNEALAGLAYARLRGAQTLHLLYAGDGSYSTAQGVWQPGAALGAAAISMATHNPHRWCPLDGRRTRRAWLAAVWRARESLAAVDPALARALAPAARDSAPGFRLRTCGDDVQIRWRPPPGVTVRVGQGPA